MDANMENGHTNGNYLADSFSLHFMICILHALRTGERDDEKPNYEYRRHNFLKVALPLSDKFNRNNSRQRKKKCRNLVKVNHPEQEKAFEPTREIETSSQVHCLSADFLLLRR